LAILWLAALAVGEGLMLAYKISPGRVGNPPSRWPPECRIPRPSDCSTLVLFAHPHCPCTRATLDELAILMAGSGDQMKAHVLFVKPHAFPDGWERTDLWRNAAGIPGVTAWSDPDGVEARHFQATTSGQILLYDAGGRLRFRGGITRARGHAGDNPGREAILAALWEGGADSRETAVFGCPLFDE
jgi:hypothetical protein